MTSCFTGGLKINVKAFPRRQSVEKLRRSLFQPNELRIPSLEESGAVWHENRSQSRVSVLQLHNFFIYTSKIFIVDPTKDEFTFLLSPRDKEYKNNLRRTSDMTPKTIDGLNIVGLNVSGLNVSGHNVAGLNVGGLDV